MPLVSAAPKGMLMVPAEEWDVLAISFHLLFTSALARIVLYHVVVAFPILAKIGRKCGKFTSKNSVFGIFRYFEICEVRKCCSTGAMF